MHRSPSSSAPHRAASRARSRRALWTLAAITSAGAALVLGVPALAQQNYIGAERCKSCHEFEYKVWASGPHAKAYLSLTPEQLGDPKCNTCHTSLAGDDDTPMRGVQCERCHGPGRYYHRSFVMKDRELSRLVGLVEPKAEHCTQCHTEGTPSIEEFDFATMWARIDHGPDARARWQKSQGNAAAAAGKAAP